jgi:primosomal protein N' (replication factor Y) (superfamily II helicase)
MFLYCQIILPLSVKGSFTYQIPAEFQADLQPGMRVVVPFGGKKLYTGIVESLHNEAPELFAPKDVIALLDKTPIIPKPLLDFWAWMSDYYLCYIGEIYRLGVPGSFKLESKTFVRKNPELERIPWENLDENETLLMQALENKALLNLQEIEAFISKSELMKSIQALLDIRLILLDEKMEERYKAKEITYLQINQEVLASDQLKAILQQLDRAPKQKELFYYLLSQSKSGTIKLKKSDVVAAGYSGAIIKQLRDKFWVHELYQSEDRIQNYQGDVEEMPQLSIEQSRALDEIQHAFAQEEKVLLHGVTSSGKTHIYEHLIDECMQKDQNVLLLVPEISLAKQLCRRLERKYQEKLGVYHSKLNDFEKVELWRNIKNGKHKIIIGTRMALFLCFEQLSLIIVDEEHDKMYQNKDPRVSYNGKDCSFVLANLHQANLLLGSASPSVESYYLALQKKITKVELNYRFGDVALPSVALVDMNIAANELQIEKHFSQDVINAVNREIDEKRQVLMMHNRRGYAPSYACNSCHAPIHCTNCAVVLTYHKAQKELKCHYCGMAAALPQQCPSCNEDAMQPEGLGVQQFEEEVREIFQDKTIERMDLDSMRKKHAYEKLLEAFEQQQIDILIGTQMLAKGLDFDHVDLVVIPHADQMLHSPDYRAEEKAYQLMTQMAGRAGRKSGNGLLLVQTHRPKHEFFEHLRKDDSAQVYKHFLGQRKMALYPPFSKTVLLEFKHRKDVVAEKSSQFMAYILNKYLPAACILGPEPSPIKRINNLYQHQIFLKLPKSSKYSTYKKYVAQSIEEFKEASAYKSVKLEITVDY